MSKWNQIKKRLRWYRANTVEQNRMAEVCGLELCSFTISPSHNDCDQTNCHGKGDRVWASMSYGEVTECNEYVCSDCLRDYYLNFQGGLSIYTDRNCRKMDREMQARLKSGYYNP